MNEVIQKTVKLVEMGTQNLDIRLELSSNLSMVQADASFLVV